MNLRDIRDNPDLERFRGFRGVPQEDTSEFGFMRAGFVLGLAIVIVGLVLFYLASVIPFLGIVLAVLILATGLTLTTNSTNYRLLLVQGDKLVTTGPYSFSRNPAYLGCIFSTLGTFLLYVTLSIQIIPQVIPMILPFNADSFYLITVITLYYLVFIGWVYMLVYLCTKKVDQEEQELTRRFKKEYELYRRSVPRWFSFEKFWNTVFSKQNGEGDGR